MSRKMDDDDDDIPQLSSHTLAALQEFYLEQQQREGMKTSQGFNQYSIGSIEEDWVRNETSVNGAQLEE